MTFEEAATNLDKLSRNLLNVLSGDIMEQNMF